MLITTRHIAAALFVCASPLAAGARPVGVFDLVVEEPGNQVDPSIDGQYVVYSGPGPAGDGSEVFLYDILNGTTETIGGGPGDQDSPDVHLSTAAYRTPEGILIESWTTNGTFRAPPPGGDGEVANPAVHFQVAAWEHRETGQDVVVSRYRSGAPAYTLRAPGGGTPVGDQRAPAVHDDLVAYVDDARGSSVWLHDSAAGPLNWARVCSGRASGVSIGHDGVGYVVAVARSAAGGDEDIEVYDVAGRLLAALPAAGPQRNPHLAGSWVAFEDTSSPYSQVVLWRWKTPPGEPPIVFVPRPSKTQQRLNDITLAGVHEVRVVFEDVVAEGNSDIALYRLPLDPIVEDDQGSGWPIGGEPLPARPAECDDPAATVLATLVLVRTTGKPDTGSAGFVAEAPAGLDALPVLVCIHAERVSSARVSLDGEAIATPSDFEPHVVDLAIPAEVDGGEATVSGAIAGKPGSLLTVRVLAHPARAEGAEAAATEVPSWPRGGGCGNAGGLGSLALIAMFLVRRKLR